MPKKAKLGFRYIAADDELKVSTKEDLVKTKADKEYESWVKEKRRKLRWWHKNKRKLNARRRAAVRSIESRYKEAERTALARGERWEFTLEEWEQVWLDAGWIQIPGSATTQSPEGRVVPAFGLRGNPSNPHHTAMFRKDITGPWSKENTEIRFRGEVLTESVYHRDAPQ